MASPSTAKACSPTTTSFGDTYGPVNYFAYVPFELALPWDGSGTSSPASHAAAIAFDLATVAGLSPSRFDCGRGRRGRELGGGARLRLARLSVHRVRPAVELQRLAGRGAARLVAGLIRPPAGSRRHCSRWRSLAKFAPLAWRPCTRPAIAAWPRARRRRAAARCRWPSPSPSSGAAVARPRPSRRSIRAWRPSGSAPSRASSTAPLRSASGVRWPASSGCRPRSWCSPAPSPCALAFVPRRRTIPSSRRSPRRC